MRAGISAFLAVGLVVGCGTRVEPTIGTPPPSPTTSSTSTPSGSPAATATSAPSAGATASASASAVPSVSAVPSASASPSAAATASASPSAPPSSSPAASLPRGSDPVTIDPANFTTLIDNSWWPMAVGSEWRYTETDAEGTVSKVVVTVTPDTKVIMGVTTVVVHDVLSEDGNTVEDTFDWYAQDLAGNIWYFGEDTKEFTDSGVDTAGSWEAGVDGALPGVIVPADPQPGLTYREEYLAGEAEDQAMVLSIDEQAEVAAGSYTGLLMTKNFTPVEPDVLEYKWYAQDVGQVLAITVSGGSDREELDKYTAGTP
jgi:hypothetical protein